jgi:hypothetical protein
LPLEAFAREVLPFDFCVVVGLLRHFVVDFTLLDTGRIITFVTNNTSSIQLLQHTSTDDFFRDFQDTYLDSDTMAGSKLAKAVALFYLSALAVATEDVCYEDNCYRAIDRYSGLASHFLL